MQAKILSPAEREEMSKAVRGLSALAGDNGAINRALNYLGFKSASNVDINAQEVLKELNGVSNHLYSMVFATLVRAKKIDPNTALESQTLSIQELVQVLNDHQRKINQRITEIQQQISSSDLLSQRQERRDKFFADLEKIFPQDSQNQDRNRRALEEAKKQIGKLFDAKEYDLAQFSALGEKVVVLNQKLPIFWQAMNQLKAFPTEFKQNAEKELKFLFENHPEMPPEEFSRQAESVVKDTQLRFELYENYQISPKGFVPFAPDKPDRLIRMQQIHDLNSPVKPEELADYQRDVIEALFLKERTQLDNPNLKAELEQHFKDVKVRASLNGLESDSRLTLPTDAKAYELLKADRPLTPEEIKALKSHFKQSAITEIQAFQREKSIDYKLFCELVDSSIERMNEKLALVSSREADNLVEKLNSGGGQKNILEQLALKESLHQVVGKPGSAQQLNNPGAENQEPESPAPPAPGVSKG